jgi:uncharacterized protein (TIGR04562 family)
LRKAILERLVAEQANVGSLGAGPLPPLLARYIFSWETMHTIMGGQSAIDLSHLRLTHTGNEEAGRFLARYGYDLTNPVQFQDVERIRTEALGFIRGVLLPGLPVEMPAEFDTMPILEVLRLAAGDREIAVAKWGATAEVRMAWACGLLRVMHTVAHAVNYFQNNYYHEIRERILNRFVAQVRTRDDGSQYLHAQSFDVPIVRFEVKETKPLRSVVVKLLQKQENVAYDLFDHIGVRIIVHNPVDALFAVRALREEHTIMYPNVKPTRSRNTLVDLEAYDMHVRACLLRFQRGELDEIATVRAIHGFADKPQSNDQIDWNPYSSDKYQSIQFTCRQMIRFANPLFTRMRDAQEVARKHLTDRPLEEMLAALTTQGVDPEIQFFFPYEVQVMDIASYQAATEGRASYGEYKARQIVSVRKRVLPRVLQLLGVPEEPKPDRDGRAGLGGAHKAIPLRRAYSVTGILPKATVDELRAALNGDTKP